MGNLTHIVFVMDKSGSMWNLRHDTIGGFNKYLEEQKKITEGDAIVSCYMFNTNVDKVFLKKRIEDTKNITTDDYDPEGCTALYDAIGLAIKETTNINAETIPLNTVFVIITDGYENSSYKFSKDAITALIESKRNDAKWQFVFLGANIEAEDVAEDLGMDRRFAATYEADKKGTERNFAVLHNVSKMARVRGHRLKEADIMQESKEMEKVRKYRPKKTD